MHRISFFIYLISILHLGSYYTIAFKIILIQFKLPYIEYHGRCKLQVNLIM